MKKITKVVLAACAFAAVSSSAFAAKKAKTEVGIVLPTKDEPRWIQDETSFTNLLKGNASVEVLFSQGDSNKEKQNVEALLMKGIKVLIICPQDGAAAAAAAAAAKKDNVTVISYDRLITGTKDVDYYVTFDSFAVGVAQGQFLIDNLKDKSKKGNPLYLYAGAASDNNAFIFFEGAWSVLQPKIADGTFVIKNSSEAEKLSSKRNLTRAELSGVINQVTTDWNFDVAKKKAADNLTVAKASDKGDVSILAPNDGTARAIADEFAKDPAVKSYVVTGQDAEKASLEYIRNGKQTMTVWKNTAVLAKAAVDLATQVINKKAPKASKSYNNGKVDVPAIQADVTVITKSNVDIVK